jgi:outer membrane lipoprotein-sorting protein
VYQPRIKQAQVVRLGKNRDKAEYLALGLGQSPAKLRQTFDITYQGTEKVDSFLCAVLALKPRSAGAAAYFSSITLWINKADGLPVQQRLQEPNGDYLLVSFSGEKLNRKIPESVFEQKLPKDVEVQRIQ